MPHVVRLRIANVYMYPHSNGNKPVDDLLAAGIASTTINWVVRFDMVMTLVS